MKTSQSEEELARQWLQSALNGDLAAAWSTSDLISQKRIDYSDRERWCRSLWDGTPIKDRHVLVRCWRGLGDAIHFIRFAPLVREKALSLAVEAPSNLLPLLGTVPGIDDLLELDSEKLPDKNYVEIESTELPYVFRTTLDSIPSTVPYIHVPKLALSSSPKIINIGLCWCGGTFDSRRSMNLSELEPLAVLPGVHFFQLQRGPALAEAAKSRIPFLNLSDRSMCLATTASLINSLDIIVSVDTMIGHLAGALGKRTYLLLHTQADWRWFRDRGDSPWYPTMRLLRQSSAGDWRSVVNRLVALLIPNMVC